MELKNVCLERFIKGFPCTPSMILVFLPCKKNELLIFRSRYRKSTSQRNNRQNRTLPVCCIKTQS